MRLGTRSLLFGCHQVMLHPLFVLAAWWKLYGCPSWRMLLAIVIHDWGYWGCETMDGPDGERHPQWAESWCQRRGWRDIAGECIYHSRYLSRQYGHEPSRLCWADKLGTAFYPTWLWVVLARASGELHEYMDDTKYEIHDPELSRQGRPSEFFGRYKAKVTEWIEDGVAHAADKKEGR